MVNERRTTELRFRRLFVGGLAVLIALTVSLWGCRREREAVVSRRDIEASLQLRGKVAVPPSAEANILPPYEASVDRVYVTVGTLVKRGDVLIRLDAPQDEAYYQEARQRVIDAREQLRQARASHEAAVRAARRELEEARAAERAARQRAQSQLQEDRTETDSVRIIETTNPELSAAIDRRLAAERALADAEAQLQAAVAPYEQQLVAAQQQLQDAQAGLRTAMIRSPITGTVLAINARTGQVVSPSQKDPVARVVDLTAVKVYAPLREDQLRQVEPGDSARVTISELPGEELRGKVEQIYSERAGLLRGTQFVAVVDFENPRGLAKPAMNATATISLGKAENVLAVPTTAVYKTGDHYAVKIRQNGEWRERVVEVGLSDGRYTEIRSGLRENDVVLANP